VTRRQDILELQAEAATLRQMLEALPEAAVFERAGLKARLANATQALAELPAQVQRTAKAALTFDGAPVRGRQGIDARFAGQGLAEFQRLISMVAAAEQGNLKAKGPVPGTAQTQLQVTGIATGSFGFVLDELPSAADQLELDAPSDSTRVALAVDTVNEMLASVSTDDGAAELLKNLHVRVRNQLSDFLDVVASHKASMSVATDRKRTVFATPEDVVDALGRVLDTESEVAEEWLSGTLVGYLPNGRRFEILQDHTSDVLAGKLHYKLESSRLKPFMNKPCLALVETMVVTSKGRALTRHILKDLDALPDEE